MVGREGLHREVILDAFLQAGAADPASHLATGNVSFDADPADIPALTQRAGAGLGAVVGRKIEVFVRSVDELREVDADAIYSTAPFRPEIDWSPTSTSPPTSGMLRFLA